MTGFGAEEPFVDALLTELTPRLSDARDFALRHRVLLARTSNGVDVDVALGALPFEERSVVRASAWTIGDEVTLTTCSAENLVVHKGFAGRDSVAGRALIPLIPSTPVRAPVQRPATMTVKWIVEMLGMGSPGCRKGLIK
jgi:hypothetical protein